MSLCPGFLLDHDVYESTYRVLVRAGFTCTKAAELGLAQASDEAILAAAHHRGLVLITRDKGFGELVDVGRRPARGLILLRMAPEDEEVTHGQLIRLLATESALSRFTETFYTVEHDKYRVRPISSGAG